MNKKLKLYFGLFVASVLLCVVFSVNTPGNGPVYFNKTRSTYTVMSDKTLHMDIWHNAPKFNKKAKIDTVYQVVTDSMGNIDTVGTSTYSNNSWASRSYTVNLRCRNNRTEVIGLERGRESGNLSYGELEIQRAKVEFQVEECPKWIWIFVIPVFVVSVAILAWFIILIFRILRNIYRGNIFVSGVARDIERLGILMSVGFVVLFAGQLLAFFSACQAVAFENYEIVLGPIGHRSWLLAGTGLMFLSEVFRMGKDLKEDSDLTV